MAKKAHPERVNPEIARLAIGRATMRTHCYTEYIILHYRATGNLAPGCDARDLYAWYELNMPAELAQITGIKKKQSIKLETDDIYICRDGIYDEAPEM